MIYWVRHGQSTWNAAHRMQGQAIHPPLTELGRQQARSAATELATVPAGQLISSPALRATQTAEVIAGVTGLAVDVEPLVIEKGLDEDIRGVAERLSRFLDRLTAEPVIVVSHGDVIALAMQRSGHQTVSIPDNGSVTRLIHRPEPHG